MGVLDGQPVNAAITNPAFINKNQNDQMPNQLDFTSAAPALGPVVTSIQTVINAIFAFVGTSTANVYNQRPTWATNNFGTPTDTLFDRVEAIDAEFDSVTGVQAFRAGIVGVSGGLSSVTATFSTPWKDAFYVVLTGFVNTVDASPIFMQAMVTQKAASGFVATLNAAADTSNYQLHYEVRNQV